MPSEIKQIKRGGKRPGAGRPKGAPSKKDLILQTAATAVIERRGEPMDPVDAMCEVAAWAMDQWRAEADVKAQAVWADLVMDWQSKVAPYLRPRLAAVAVAAATGEDAIELIREVKRVIVDPRNA